MGQPCRGWRYVSAPDCDNCARALHQNRYRKCAGGLPVTHPHYHWTFDPAQLVVVVVYVVVYLRRFFQARKEAGGRGAGPLQFACFVLAVFVLLIALVSPIDALGEDYLFSMHMVQHILLG